MRVLKLKFSQQIINNGEKCGWLKQTRAADEKHVSNKWCMALAITNYINFQLHTPATRATFLFEHCLASA